jgi:hypothetical protein
MLRPVLIATAVAGAWAIPLALGGLAEARGDDAAASKSDLRPALQPGALLGQLGELFRLPGFDRNIHANAVSMLPRAETSSALTPSVMRISGAAA